MNFSSRLHRGGTSRRAAALPGCVFWALLLNAHLPALLCLPCLSPRPTISKPWQTLSTTFAADLAGNERQKNATARPRCVLFPKTLQARAAMSSCPPPSACCIITILTILPLIPTAGESDIDQLYIIQRMLGPITPEHQHIFVRNPRFTGLKFPDMSRPETLERKYAGKMGAEALSFLKATLTMEPGGRITCPQVRVVGLGG